MNTTVTPRELTAEERQFLIDTLFRERCSCVIRSGDVIRIFRERGVKDLFRLLKEEPVMLRGAFIADKVVGKAAAALMVLGGVLMDCIFWPGHQEECRNELILRLEIIKHGCTAETSGPRR